MVVTEVLRLRARRMVALLLFAALTIAALATALMGTAAPLQAAAGGDATHLGVASCSGTTCHGRSQPDGKIVRQDEILRWQEPSSPTGSHYRAYAILFQPRSKQIADRLGIGDATRAQMCLGCHSENAASRGPKYQVSDGIGCEACHGGAANWIESHDNGNHASNIANGMRALDRPQVRAGVCLDCHFGSADSGQFVTHRMMAAGHPRISFELDLFSTLQQHHNEDADYYGERRKLRTNGVRNWAVGQAMAVERSLSLFSNPGRGMEGAFPEFYFFDCHTCHRRISDSENFVPSGARNPGRAIPLGMPAYNDENMIMLSAAARTAAPGLGKRFDDDVRAFHLAMGKDRGSAVAAAGRLQGSAKALADAFAGASFGRTETFAIIDMIASDAISSRFTDYEGAVQAVMAVDTLLNALVNSGQIGDGAATGIRAEVNRAYAAVREPNAFNPGEFRRALGNAVRTIRTLR
jgi:hypothetical protein